MAIINGPFNLTAALVTCVIISTLQQVNGFSLRITGLIRINMRINPDQFIEGKIKKYKLLF